MAKRNVKPQRKKERFLAAYRECGNVAHAARSAKTDRTCHYRWLREDPDYAVAFAHAEEDAADALEQEARRRAHYGVNEPVIHQGQLMGVWVDAKGERAAENAPGAKFVPLTVKKFSDTLLIFLMKGARPQKYRDNADITSGGKPLANTDYSSMSTDDLRAIREILSKQKTSDISRN